jgi:hypothetical protein
MENKMVDEEKVERIVEKAILTHEKTMHGVVNK